MKKTAGMATVLAASLALPLGLGAATAGAAAAPRDPAVSAQDVRWMQSNARTDLAEIAVGKIALARAQYAATKKMAEVTVTDHEAALAKLTVLARKLEVTMPGAPNALQQAEAATLRTVTLANFDLDYDALQIAGHLLSISTTKTEIAVGKDAAVIAFAKYYLPVAQKHLSMAEADYAALPVG